jgi:hypothetical protein
MYIIFTGFENFQILAQNAKVNAFSFTEKHQFVAKTDQNSIFLDREAHILNWVYIMVMGKFLWVLKNFKFQLKIQRC